MGEKLIVKNSVKVVSLDMAKDVAVIEVPLGGLIEAKAGKETHVTVADRLTLPRSDGRTMTVQVNAWYK